jgi:SAM-dependent methyltransferase
MDKIKQPFVFIDPETSISKGDVAEKLLAEINDKVFLKQGSGVVEVTEDRWRLAQKAEHIYWMKKGLRIRDDRNFHHSRAFKKYAVLANAHFKNALELGCGPFTNLRVIAHHCTIEKCVLLDPLILSYLDHPYCAYTHTHLRLSPSSNLGRKLHKLKPSWHNKLQEWRGKTIAIDQVHAMPIEKFTPDRTFDLVVMLNVLEHCLSAEVIFEKILSCTHPGSLFIFQDRLYDYQHIQDSLECMYDAAHPLKVDKTVIHSFLLEKFKPLVNETNLEEDDFLLANNGKTEMFYFIGERK